MIAHNPLESDLVQYGIQDYVILGITITSTRHTSRNYNTNNNTIIDIKGSNVVIVSLRDNNNSNNKTRTVLTARAIATTAAATLSHSGGSLQ